MTRELLVGQGMDQWRAQQGEAPDVVAEVEKALAEHDAGLFTDAASDLRDDCASRVRTWLRALVQRTQARGYVNVLTLAPDGRRLGTRIVRSRQT